MLETALNRSVDEVLGQKAEALRSRIKTNYRPSSAVMPTAEAMVLWLKTNLPEQSAYIRARARHHYHLLLHPPGSTLRVE
jgi:hypothetical protein